MKMLVFLRLLMKELSAWSLSRTAKLQALPRLVDRRQSVIDSRASDLDFCARSSPATMLANYRRT